MPACFTWSYSPFATWTLQASSDLSSTNCAPTSGTVSNDGTNNYLTLSPEAGNLFFRPI
jgi:hypothetical protein